MKKTVHVCFKCRHIEISKIASKDSIVYEKECSQCKAPMSFIRKNKKKYKDKLKRKKVG